MGNDNDIISEDESDIESVDQSCKQIERIQCKYKDGLFETR